jgi:hypothetical protein
MAATKLLLKITDDKEFVRMLREVAINFVVACEVKLEIPATKSAISTRRLKAISNSDA